MDDVARLEAGEGFTDLSNWRKVEVSGADAGGWLQDLVSADLSGLVPGQARRSLLLSPTGRIRAEFTVARTEQGWLLLQDLTHQRPVDRLMGPYVLSSRVTLEDRTEDLALLALPGRREPLDAEPADRFAPSCLGGGAGLDLVVRAGDHRTLSTALRDRLVEAGGEAVEGWRVRAGIPRYGVDATEDDLPQEAGLDDLVAFDKGCYLGQEAVAKVRNLGHPRRLVLHLEAPGQVVSPGDTVRCGGDDVGVVTSAASDGDGDGTVVLARIRWHAREGPFETGSGTPLLRPQASSPV